MTRALHALDHTYSLEQQIIEYYADLHGEVKTHRRALFALANEVSQTERHLDVLFQQLIRKVQDLEVELSDLADNQPADQE